MRFLTGCLLLLILLFTAPASAQVKVIPVGHSHNDYTRKHPLIDALENGFFSVEVDIFYRDGKFLAAHTVLGIRKKKTLESLYLKPLQKIVKDNNGKVYADGPLEFELMIDTKGKWTDEQMRELEKALLEYEELFTIYKDGTPQRKAVRVLLSGGSYVNKIKDDNPRLFSADAGMSDINSPLGNDIICRNSAPYGSYFKWKGRGEIPKKEKEMLEKLCDDSKVYGRKLRFWACPQNKNVWRTLLDAGAGWINIDNLKKFRSFYWNEYKSNQ